MANFLNNNSNSVDSIDLANSFNISNEFEHNQLQLNTQLNTQSNTQSNTLDHRYSRQSYAIGQDAQIKLSETSVLVIGYNSLAQEIIRNLILTGVAKIDIYHKKNLENHQKSGLYYSVDNGVPLKELSKLNPNVQINTIEILDNNGKLDELIIKKFNIIILTNSTFEDAIELNHLTHKLSIPFIMGGTYGLMGYLFNDFGEKFQVNDLDGENSEPLIIKSIDNKIITFKDEHKLSDGDIIIVDMQDNNQIEYKIHNKCTPFVIELDEIPNQDKTQYIKILRKKISQIFEFESLKKNIDDINYVIADWSVPMDRSKLLHKFHQSLDKYFFDYKTYPRSWSIPDYEIYEKYLNLESNQDKMLAKKFCFTLKGDLLPLVSIIGGIVTHEVLKAITHKYIPITQWYYMDYLDLISDSEIDQYNDYTSKNFKTKTKYEGIVNIFGKNFLNEFQKTVPFVIGSGAIGCELLKNLGMMGVNQIYLTDPDHIEKSNLSRQFLFNDDDIRQSKAETAAKKIKSMNPNINVNVFKHKMCNETSEFFNNDFHSKIDVYLNALDNVDARKYMDLQAIKYSKPLIDSGTLGSKGNVQVIIPHLTESYGSSDDPDEKGGIPICTIKSFPYKPEHTIQWARELFETEFNQIPIYLNKYKNINELEKINDSDSKNLIKQLHKYKEFEYSEYFYLKLLFTIYIENHIYNIKEIIDKFSKNENNEELGDKKLPIYMDLNHNQSNFNLFVSYIFDGFKLLNQIFNTNIVFDTINIKYFKDFVSRTDLILSQETIDMNSNKIIEELFHIVNVVPNTKPIEFEKDDDELGHVSWITSSANMRNIQYFIPHTDLYQTRIITGNIIPAMITTTSLVSGFQILEYIRICKLYKKNKYLKNPANSSNSSNPTDPTDPTDPTKDIDLYKNRYVNLNTNYCDGINPTKVKMYKLDNGNELSLWTNFSVSNLDTSKIINQIEQLTGKKITFMLCGNKIAFDGDDIIIHKLDKLDAFDMNKIEILFDDIPFGIPIQIPNPISNQK